MKKKSPAKKAPSTSSRKKTSKKVTKKLQDAKYWVDRPVDDAQRDWNYGATNWIEDYKLSVAHPHRRLIIEQLATFEWNSLLEIGCSAGPNLRLIRQNFPDKLLFGIDVSEPSIQAAHEFLSDGTVLRVQAIEDLPSTQHYDVILADAALMYIAPSDVPRVMDRIAKIASNVIIIDRFADSLTGEETSHVWGRDYTTLLASRGFVVEARPLKIHEWPTSAGWAKHGCIFVARRPSATSEKS